MSQLKRTSENTVLRIAIVSNDISPHFDLSCSQPLSEKSKCCWLYSSFEFLGFVVGDGKLTISDAKVAHIRNYLPPKRKTDLRAFLGLTSFYSRFIPSFSDHTSVLNSYLRKDKPDILHYNDDSEFNLSIVSFPK